MAQRHRQKDPPAAPEYRAHRRRPRLPGRAERAGPSAGVGGRPDRSAAPGLPPLPARRPDARRQSRRLRRPCARAGPIGPSSWSGSAAPCGPRPCRTASRPICATTHLTGPWTTTGSGPPSWSSSTTRIAQTHFLRVAREEMRAEQVTVPLWVSHREAIDALGPLGGAWRTPDEWQSPKTLPPPANPDKPAGA